MTFSEPASENATRELYTRLPARFVDLADFDKICVLSVCIDSIRNTLSPLFSRDFDIKIDKHLKRIVELSRELSEHLDRVSEITFVGERNLRQAWNAQVFGTFSMKSRDGYELEMPAHVMDPINYRTSPAGAIRILTDIAGQAYRARKRTAPKHRPNEDLLLAIVYPLVRAWTALECMTGKPLHNCLPNKRNGGQQWCVDTVSMISSGTLLGKNRLGGRTERTVTTAIRKANKELKRRLQSTPFAEHATRWKELNWQSSCGLDLLYRAAMPPGRDCLLRQGAFIDEFDRKHSDWIHSLEKIEQPDWVDDV